VAFTKVLTVCQIYHTWIHLLHHSPLSFFSPFLEVSTGVIFPVTNMCTQYLYYIHFPRLFLHLLPLPLAPTSNPRKDLFSLPLSNFVKVKKMTIFFLFKIATQGVSLWHSHVYMNYNPTWFISSVLHLSTLVPFTPSFFLLRWGLMNFLPGLTSNGDPSDLSLQVVRTTCIIHQHLAYLCF
jgi:hypothetical protein